MSKKYIKKPVVVDAFQFCIDNIPEWFIDKIHSKEVNLYRLMSNKVSLRTTAKQMEESNIHTYCEIETLEGVMRCDFGDFIIKGVNGEIYPCKADIFFKTYDEF